MGLKYPVNERFFNAWNNDSAYVLGFLYADGSMENAPSIRGKYVRATSTDKDRIDLIKTKLSSGHSIVSEQKTANRKQSYLLRIV